jgi:hypothetical protein
MNAKTPSPTKEERLAKALRENLARRKALVRTKRQRAGSEAPAASAPPSDRDGAKPPRP